MQQEKTRRMVLLALMAALVCVSTLVIRLPSPTNGYVNLGDSFVLLSAWLLGPIAAVAAGVGAAMADLVAGYAYYAPASLLIKALMALTAALFDRLLPNGKGRLPGGVLAEAEMVGLYFLFAALLLGRGTGAALSIPGNLVQGTVAVLAGLMLFKAVSRAGVQKFLHTTPRRG